MTTNCTKILFFFLYFTLFSAFANDEINVLSLKDIEKINKNLKYDNLITIKDGKVQVDQNPTRIFLFSKEKYYSNITYSNQLRDVGIKSETFYERWIKARYYNNNNSLRSGSDSTNIILVVNQINLFYRELVISDEGKLYYFLVPVPLAKKMEKELKKSEKIQIEFLHLGRDISNGDNFFVITNFSKTNVKKEIVAESDFIRAKELIRSNQYDAATAKLNTFLKKYPNHLDARKELCNAKYLKSLKLNDSSRSNSDLITCYEDLTKFYENETVYYMLASLYYSNKTIKTLDRQKKILEYTSKAIELIRKSGNGERIIYYNCLYLRGITKLNMNNDEGLEDLKTVQDERPDLVNLDSYSQN